MHSKKKGNIGQLAVALEFSKLGFSVFTEEGDISKIDLIVEKNQKLLTVQVKSITPKNGKILLPLKNNGPNYNSKYKKEMFDYFGVYDLKNSKVYIVPSSILDSYGKSFSLRITPTKNNQTKMVRMADEFLPEKILRDYTGNI